MTALSLADLVEEQARRRPSAVAVVAGQASLTYADLDARANRLAHHLQGFGVGAEALVGISMVRSLEMAVAILAVLKAGGACLPLDPSYPADRLAFMLADSGAAVLLTLAHLVERLPAHDRATVCLDADWPEVARQPDHAPRRDVRPENLAYVIYTSGSTGEPKGVMLTHRGLVHHNRAIRNLFELVPSDRVLQFCSISFDVSIEEILPTWGTGATVVLRPDNLPLLGRPWLEWVTEQGITVVNLPTAYWQQWGRDLAVMGEQMPSTVRLTVVGGEKVTAGGYRTWMEVGGDRARWLNAYGPAEASVTATAYDPSLLGSVDAVDGRDPPIGRPVGRTTVHILDDGGRPVVAGGVGELCMGGDSLARGYLHRPALTAERFVPDPFGGRPGARLYRTGDRGRWLPSGEIEFLGRLDHQVKVRGFRIESGEVEAALTAYPAVSDAVVVAREDAPGDTRLVAYVVASGEAAPTASALRQFVADRLPPYMVPGAFVTLDALPHTPNGKVDRAALPAPPRSRPDLATPWVAPAGPAEEAMAAIWSQVLGIDGLGADDDFFDLGGHSLLATQIVARAREAFGRDLPLEAIFEAPTIAGLTAAVVGSSVAGSCSSVPPLVARPRVPGQRLPLTLGQQQMLTLELQATPPGLYNVTAMHRFLGVVDLGALRRALQFMVERHETLHTAFEVDDDGVGWQVVAPAATAEVAVSDLYDVPADERQTELQRRIAAQDAEPFDLATAPAFRAALMTVDDTENHLVATFDHLICDMTSAYIFLGEVATAYDALADGRTPELAPLPVQFADFAMWQREWLTEERLASEYEYWRTVLTGMPMGPALPFDHVPASPSRRIIQRSLSVEPDLYRRLETLARAAQATPFVVCIAGVASVLSRMGSTTDVVLSTTLSGRQRNECEGMIGMFAGMGRMRVDLSGDPPFAELVQRARRTVLGLFEHQDIPFMMVRDALFPDFPKQGDYARTALMIPVELLYFHAAHDHWAPGSGVVARPGSEAAVDDMFFRGQLQPLSLTFVDDGNRMWGHVSYKVDFYDESTIDGLVSSVEAVLGAVGDDPGLRLADLPV
ncbi:MAG: amino acid adenylation domain-containing protein [Acidimicrobiales bacterium]